MFSELPTIGAALTLPTLEQQHNWLKEGARDVEIQDFTRAEVLDGHWRPTAERARDLLDGHEGRVGIHGPFWGFNIASPDPAIRDVVRMRLNQGLDVCEVLRGTHMVVHSPFTTWDYNNFGNFPGARGSLIDYAHLTLGDIVKRAEDIGVTLVLENIEDKDPMDRLRLADSFESEAVALSIDTGHAYYAHGSTGAPPVDYYVRMAGTRLAHMHVQDADGYSDRHWAPGEGTINWYAIFEALRDTGATPRLVLELRDETKLRQGADWLIEHGLCR